MVGLKGAKPAHFPEKGPNDVMLYTTITPSSPTPQVATEFPWHAVRTRSNYERTTSTVLADKGYQQYLPMYCAKRRWSDRVVLTSLPLFPGYVFCRFDSKQRVPILNTPGVFAIVGLGTEAAPIPDQEIEALQRVLQSGLATGPCPFLREGQRIRIKSGSLKDLEGILVKRKSEWRMVVSVPMLQRSVSVEIDAEWITSA
jgi:transcription antitermination factor NusG